MKEAEGKLKAMIAEKRGRKYPRPWDLKLQPKSKPRKVLGPETLDRRKAINFKNLFELHDMDDWYKSMNPPPKK